MFYGGIGGITGGLLGGYLGDFFDKMWPYRGRCAVAQASVLLGTVCFCGLMSVGGDNFALTAGLHFVFNAVATWTPAAALRPICGVIFRDSQDRAQVGVSSISRL